MLYIFNHNFLFIKYFFFFFKRFHGIRKIKENCSIYIFFISNLIIFILFYYNYYIYIVNIIYFLLYFFLINIVIEKKFIVKFIFELFICIILLYNNVLIRILNIHIFHLINKYKYFYFFWILIIVHIFLINFLLFLLYITIKYLYIYYKFKIKLLLKFSKFIKEIVNILLLFIFINYLEKLPFYFFNKKINNKEIFIKKKVKNNILYFEKFISNIFINFTKNKEPLRYIKNEMIENDIINYMSQFFFLICQSDGKKKISFTYPYSLSFFLEKIKKNYLIIDNFIYNKNKINKKNNIFLKLMNIFSNKVRLFNISNKKYLYNKYDPLLNMYYIIINKSSIINNIINNIYINNLINKIFLIYYKKLKIRKKFQNIIFLKKYKINKIYKKIYKFSYKFVTEFEQQKMENYNEIIFEDYEIKSRKYKNIIIYNEILKNMNEKKNINEIYLIEYFKQLDFYRDIIKGSIHIKRRKININNLLIQLNINSIFFSNKNIELNIIKNILCYVNNISKKTIYKKENEDINFGDFINIYQTIRSFILLTQSIFRKYIILPLLIIIKNIIFLILFKYSNLNEDFYKWNREKHIKCTYNGVYLSEKEFPKDWLTDGIQIKILFPFSFKSINNNNIFGFLTIWGNIEIKYNFLSNNTIKKKYYFNYFNLIINKKNIYFIFLNILKYMQKLKLCFKHSLLLNRKLNKKNNTICNNILNNNIYILYKNNKNKNINKIYFIYIFKLIKILNNIINNIMLFYIKFKKYKIINKRYIYKKIINLHIFYKLIYKFINYKNINLTINNKKKKYCEYSKYKINFFKIFKYNFYFYLSKYKNYNNNYILDKNKNIIKLYNKLLYLYINYKNNLNNLLIYNYIIKINNNNILKKRNINWFNFIKTTQNILNIKNIKKLNINININKLNINININKLKYLIIQIKLNYFLNQKIINNIKIYCLFLKIINKRLILTFIKKKYISINMILNFDFINNLIEKNILIIKPFILFKNITYNKFFIIYQFFFIYYKKKIKKYNKYNNIYFENIISYRYYKQLRILIYLKKLSFFENILKFNINKKKLYKFFIYYKLNYKFEDLIYVNNYFFDIEKKFSVFRLK